MAEAGDVTGILGWLRERSVLNIPPDALDYLARTIRKGQANLDVLVDAAYGEVIGFVLVLITRCELHVERRLAEAGRYGGDPTHLPVDLDSEGWLERIERLSRFLMEITTARSRVQHISRLNNEAKQTKHQPRTFEQTWPMAADRVQTPQGKGPARNGRNHCQAERIVFP